MGKMDKKVVGDDQPIESFKGDNKYSTKKRLK